MDITYGLLSVYKVFNGLYPFQDALKVLTSLDVVACVCTPLDERNKSE